MPKKSSGIGKVLAIKQVRSKPRSKATPAQAAAVAAAGAAQIATIHSASRGGGSKVASPAATSGGVASAAMNRTLTVQGITPGQIFSGDSMRDFMERMLEMQRDGYQVVLA